MLKDTSRAQTFPYIYRGQVEDIDDPKKLGRVRVRVPGAHGDNSQTPSGILPWARPITLSPISHGRGSVNLPDKGDIVWVFFEGGNKRFPLYFGGTYGYLNYQTKPDCPTCIKPAPT